MFNMDYHQESTSTDSTDDFLFRAPLGRATSTISRTYLDDPSTSSSMYSEVRKTQKRVYFWDDVNSSSTTTTTTTDDENRRATPLASPSKFPKTNPFFKGLPPKDAKLGFATIRQLGAGDRPLSASQCTFDSDPSTTTSGDTTESELRPDSADSQRSAGLRRVVAGLKGFGIKGELYLNILLNRNLLTITIDEARNLVAPVGSTCCSSYVRVSLMPDEEKRTQCKTELVPHSNQPVFNQTFTFELLPEDFDKRLLISVWHRQTITQKSTFLGCMSFTVRSLVQSNKVTR